MEVRKGPLHAAPWQQESVRYSNADVERTGAGPDGSAEQLGRLAGVGQVLRRGQEQGRQFVHARLAEACARPGHAEHAESPSVLGWHTSAAIAAMPGAEHSICQA